MKLGGVRHSEMTIEARYRSPYIEVREAERKLADKKALFNRLLTVMSKPELAAMMGLEVGEVDSILNSPVQPETMAGNG